MEVVVNNQEAFDKAYAGLSAQGFAQSSLGDRCKYRGPDGRRCAVGHLIPDDEYREEFDRPFSGLLLYGVRRQCPSLSGVSLRRLIELRRAHDRTRGPDDMRERLLRVAKMFQLTPPTREDGADRGAP